MCACVRCVFNVPITAYVTMRGVHSLKSRREWNLRPLVYFLRVHHVGCHFTIYSLFMDIHKSFLDIQKSC